MFNINEDEIDIEDFEYYEPFWKRPFDIFFASAVLLLSIPIFLMVCIVLFIEGRKIFFVQERWGRYGKRIKVIKFRTMFPKAADNIQASPNDPRITKIGNFLRKTGIDELPQVINVLKGEMSIVGPRPLPINEKQVQDTNPLPDDKIPGFSVRIKAKPGITGLSQILLRRNTTREQKYKYDIYYMKKLSLLMDIRIILKTIKIAIMRKAD